MIETELPKIPNSYNEKRKEWHEKKQELIKEYKDKSTNFDLLNQKLENKEKEYEEEKTDNGNTDRLGKLEKEILEIKQSIELIKKEILDIVEKGNLLDTEMMQELSKVEFGDKEQIENKETKIRETISFIEQIGFDLLPQSATDSIIRQYNVGKGEGLQIDLSAGDFGINPANKNPSSILVQEKTSFIDFFNKMVTGKDSEKPLFSKEEITIFQNGGKLGLSKDQFRSRLSPIMSNTGVVDIGRAVNNLK